jgi:Beta-propeller repeat
MSRLELRVLVPVPALLAAVRAAAAVGAGVAALASARPGAAAVPTPAPPARVAAHLLAGLPQSCEANAGQVGPDVEFLCRGAAGTLLLSHGDAILAPRRDAGDTVRLRLAGEARHPRGEGRLRQAGVSNYLLGADPRRWHTDIPNYGEVHYAGVFRGIDLVYRGGDRRHFEYDFVVAPGADPRQIRLAIDSAPAGDRLATSAGAAATDGTIHLGPHGELIVPGAEGDLVQPAPVIYQEVGSGGGRRTVSGRYVLTRPAGRHLPRRVEVSFAVAAYDTSRPLVIDPQIVYSTFLGGSGDDGASALAVDVAGNAYLTGSTYSTDFPGIGAGSIQQGFGGNYVPFVVKINAAGTGIVYSTYLGGSVADFALAIAVDAAGNAYLAGATASPDFPGVSASSIQPTLGGNYDAFVVKINPAGNGIVYSTFLGGTGMDVAYGIAVDSPGNAYVTGSTASDGFPGVKGSSLQFSNAGGYSDAFLAKIDAAGTAIVYATYLGGIGEDIAYAIAVDAGGNAYLTGDTWSAAFPGISGGSIQPAIGGAPDAFVTKIDAAGRAILYSTFLGDSSYDAGHGIAVDGAGNAYVVGATLSPSFPGVGPGSLQPNPSGAFVTKIDAAGNAIVYSTFLGGAGNTAAMAVAVDRAGNAYVTGNTTSTNFNGVGSGSVQPANGGGTDAFMAELDPSGTAIVYSTYLGGSGTDMGYGIAIDGAGNAYVAGATSSTSFPGVSGSSLQPANAGGANGQDAFLTKISNGNANLAFYTLLPCRVFDTRGGAPLAAGEARRFQVTGVCGIPATAKAISANLTVVRPQQPGFLTLLPGDAALELLTTSNLNFHAGDVRANNAIVLLSYSGTGTIYVFAALAGTTDALLDVNGYFQ